MSLKMYLNTQAESWLRYNQVRKPLCFPVGKQDSWSLGRISSNMYFSFMSPFNTAEVWSRLCPGSHSQAPSTVATEPRSVPTLISAWDKAVLTVVVGILSVWRVITVSSAKVSRFQWNWDVSRYGSKSLLWIKTEAEAVVSKNQKKPHRSKHQLRKLQTITEQEQSIIHLK